MRLDDKNNENVDLFFILIWLLNLIF